MTQDVLGLQDFLADFYAAQRRTRETSKTLPHIRFANATDDDRLIEFVRDFGPVLGRVAAVPADGGPVSVIQNLKVLQTEQQVFTATLKTVSVVNRLEPACSIIFGPKDPRFRLSKGNKTDLDQLGPLLSELADSIHRAERLEGEERLCDAFGGDMKPAWNSPPLQYSLKTLRATLAAPGGKFDILSNAHRLVCDILNIFPPLLVFSHGTTIESPAAVQTGIRPLLYFLLREVYLAKHRLVRCKREDCGSFFVPDRGNGEYCSLACGNTFRQRDNYTKKKLLAHEPSPCSSDGIREE